MKELDDRINTENACCTCLRQESIDRTAWIYCEKLHDMLIIDGFDETGEKHGCHSHMESNVLPTTKLCITRPTAS